MKKTNANAWAYPLGIIACFLLTLSLFLSAFMLTVFNRDFAHDEMHKYHVAQNVGMTEEGIDHLFDRMLDYLSDRADTFDVTVEKDGVTQKAFSEKEILHMVDVKALFDAADIALVASLSFALAILAFLMVTHAGRVVYRSFFIGGGIFLSLAAVLAGAVAINFDDSFILFHKIFFTNDFWMLDYSTDLLMNIVPESYSFDVIVRTLWLFAVAFGLLGIGSTFGILLTRKAGEPTVKQAGEP